MHTCHTDTQRTTAVRARRSIGILVELHLVQHLRHKHVETLARHATNAPVKIQVLARAHQVVERVELRTIADEAARARTLRRHVQAIDEGAAARRLLVAAQDA